MAANEDALGNLHTKLAKVLDTLLDGDVLPGYEDEETGESVPDKVMPPSASVLTVVAKFLKDNNVTCVPSKDNALGALKDKLEAQKAAAEDRRKAQIKRIEAGPADFMEGLH